MAKLGPWWGGPRPHHPPGPEDAWDEPPWEPRRRRGRRRWCPPHARAPRAFPWNEEEEDGRWAPPWDDREAIVGPEEDFTRDDFTDEWLPPGHRAPGPCPGDGPWKEEEEWDGRWAPHGCAPPPPWGDRDFQGPENGFGEGWHPELPPEPWPEFPEEEQPWPPAGPAGAPRGFRGCRPPWGHHRPGGRRGRRPRGSHHRQLTPVPQQWCPQPPRGPKPRPKPSPAVSKQSQPTARKEPQPPDPPEPPAPVPGAVEGPEQSQDLPEGSGRVLEPPGPAGTPPGATEAEQVAAVTPVELEAEQDSVSSQDQDCCALGREESSARIQGHLEVEPLSPAVPKAGLGDGARPPSPAAPPDPAGREFLHSSPSAEARAELSPRSQEQQPSGAGEAEAEAVWNGPLQSLQPPQNSEEFCPQELCPPGAAADPEAQPPAPDACTPPEPPPEPPPLPGPRETEPAESGQHQLCSTLPSPFPAGIDFRSAAVLARKAQIELSYQQFSLTIAVVATMLLQKEPSMEAALGLALRANLRQCRIHHLQELEDFIDSYDSATADL